MIVFISKQAALSYLAWDVLVAMLVVAGTVTSVVAEEIRFNEQIRPILAENCLACHGPDPAARQADLRLDTEEGAIPSGAIEPGNASESELVARIQTDDPELVMPPPDSHKRLTEQEKQLLVKWINEGAEWEKHWSFIAPTRPTPPDAGDHAWPRNAIDYFVLARLKSKGLAPNPRASTHTLARRTALDLTGLPPTDDQLRSFLGASAEDAFSDFVDLLLESSHAGEHRARYWLDAARYGDTHGMHVDNYREMWPYRDWVINAFNRNMPFDQFVVEQIAGDLLPNRTLDQQIATGFSRCNITTSEGGAIPEEVNVRYMVDRVETTATVFLGLTAGCAVCHDHKYDPLTQREFYQLGAFFNNTTQPAMDGNQKDTPPVVVLPKPEFQDEWAALKKERASLLSELDEWKPPGERWWTTRDRGLDHPVAPDSLALHWPLVAGAEGAALPEAATWAQDHPAGVRGMIFGGEVDLETEFPPLRSDSPLTVSFWMRTPDVIRGTTVLEQTEQKGDKQDDKKTLGWKISTNTDNGLTFEMHDGEGNSIRGHLPDNDALRPRAWQHVCVRYSGGQSTSSITIFNDGREIALRRASENLIEAVELAETPLQVARNMPTAGLSDVRIYRRWLTDEEVNLLAAEHRLRELVSSETAWSDLATNDQQLLESLYRQTLDANYQVRSRVFSESSKRYDFIYSRSTTTLVMEEREQLPTAFVLERGEYTKRKEQVTPDVPAVMPPLGDGPANRLALAKWLVDPANPLVARVMVNRLWQSIFGVGLVKTSEDFGVMGDRPSHPQLLDWLAVEFVESGWDVNHMLKLMVTSATYRQSSLVSAQKLSKDSENRLLSRGPRYRLDAELVRDQALAVSGLLRRDVGGPSVKPYQPSGLWNVVAITGSNTRHFKRDTGGKLYRRSLYTFWKRTSPPPSMAAFNAPTREQCTVRRERTNTPLQALVLMNDVQFVESAKYLADHTLSRLTDHEARAASMFEEVLRRPPTGEETTEIAEMASSFRAVFQASPDDANELLKAGEVAVGDVADPAELAAWTLVASTLMNRDDFVNK